MVHLITEVIQLFLCTDDDIPDNQSSLEFHLKVFTSLVDLRPKSPSECHCVLVKPINFTSTQIRLIPFKQESSDCKFMQVYAEENDISIIKIKQHFRFLCFLILTCERKPFWGIYLTELSFQQNH